MGEESSDTKTDKFQQLENKIAVILNKDQGVKASYSELRNFYSIMTNDTKAAMLKKLSKTLSWLIPVVEQNLKTRSIKKDAYLYEIESGLAKYLDSTPDLNPQNHLAIFQYLRELLPFLVKNKAKLAKDLAAEKKDKKAQQLERQLDNIDGLSIQLHGIYLAFVDFNFFDHFLLSFIKADYNRDDIRQTVTQSHAILKKVLTVAKDADLDIENLKLIDLITARILIRMGLYESCSYQKLFKEVLRRLPRLLVQQFNTRYFAKKRDSSKSLEELKSSTEYKAMTKKFLTLKMKKFYQLQRIYLMHVGRIFSLSDNMRSEFAAFLEAVSDKERIGEKRQLVNKLQVNLRNKRASFQAIFSGLPRNEELGKNSIRTLYTYMLNFYYNVLKDAYHPLGWQELAIRYIKKGNISKDMVMNSAELNFLTNSAFSRNEEVLRLFYSGIMELLEGEPDERRYIRSVLTAIGKEYDRSKKEEMWQTTVDTFVENISPEEIAMLTDIIQSLPDDVKRMNTQVGRLFQEVVEKYPVMLKNKLNHIEKIEPTDSPAEKLRKTVTEKFYHLIFKEAGPKRDEVSPVEILKKKKESEQKAIQATAEEAEQHGLYHIAKLIAYWKVETEKTVIGLCLGSRDAYKPSERYQEFDRNEMKLINTYFNSEHLGEIEKHYKVMTECIGEDYLKYPKPYVKIEYIILFAAKKLLVDFRNPAKSYPRTYERMTAVSGKKS